MIKIEITTCEQYVLTELKDAKAEIEELEETISQLKEYTGFLTALLFEYDPQWDSKLLGEGDKIPS